MAISIWCNVADCNEIATCIYVKPVSKDINIVHSFCDKHRCVLTTDETGLEKEEKQHEHNNNS